jgi:hypothetical protein
MLESWKQESQSEIEKWRALMPWMTFDEMATSFGYSQQVPDSPMSQRAWSRAEAVQKYCEKLNMTMDGRVAFCKMIWVVD